MRVLYVVIAAEFSGPSRHVLWLARHLIQGGDTVGIVGAPEPRLVSDSERIGVEFFANPYAQRRIRPHNDIRSIWPVLGAIRRFRPNLISVHGSKAHLITRIACTVLNCEAVIFTAHGWPFSEGRSGWRRRLLAIAARVSATIADEIICVSEHDRELALRFKVASPHNLRVILNGVDPQPILDCVEGGIRKELGLEKATILTMVGRLVPQKDPFTLLQTCLLLKRRRDVRVLIVGDGELRAQVERFVSENGLGDTVVLLGERQDIPEILADSNVFLLSSLWEGLPRAIIEAMMAGLPVVATRVGGIPELVDDGATGFLVPPGDPEALAKATQELLDNEELRHRMGRAAKEKALKEFTLDRMLAETLSVYEGVSDSKGLRPSRPQDHRPGGKG